MRISRRIVSGRNTSQAWVNVIRYLDTLPGDEAYHLVTQIERPTEEEPAVRQAVDELLKKVDLAPVGTVRNTIFPASLAERFPKPSTLAAEYRRLYPRICGFHQNKFGTYFGRLVTLTTDGKSDQLNGVLVKLRSAFRRKARYEIALGNFDDLAMTVYSDKKDGKRPIGGFPCLSFLSFQRDDDSLHLMAYYRNHYLVERGYGNYVGLGALLGYVAQHSSLFPGVLTVVAGHAQIEKHIRLVRSALQSCGGMEDRIGADDGL